MRLFVALLVPLTGAVVAGAVLALPGAPVAHAAPDVKLSTCVVATDNDAAKLATRLQEAIDQHLVAGRKTIDLVKYENGITQGAIVCGW